MMQKERNIILQLYLIFFITYSYFIGGFVQFFLGFSNTVITFFTILSFLVFYFFSSKNKVKKEGFNYSLILLIMVLYTFIISIVNNEFIVKPLLYSLFFLVPLGIYLLIKNTQNFNSKSLNNRRIKKVLLLVAIFQLPILLFQKYFYSFLISLNNSSQQIAHVDFTFGSFFIKNDHALGFFLVVNLLYIWSYPILKNKFQRNLVSIIIIASLFISNSNTSILYLFGAITILIFRNRESISKIRVDRVFYLLIFLLIIYLIVDFFEPKFYLDLQNKLSNSLDYKTAVKWYKQGQARREQIVVLLIKDGLNFFGNGAYAYFDILKSEFTRNFRHFSQLIWIYYDIGLIGLLGFLMIIFKTNKLFKDNSSSYSMYLSIGILIYSFFTIVTFDINFILTYFIYKYQDND